MNTTANTTWTDICPASDLTPNAGICALYNEQQVAIFLCKKTNNVYAIANYDPFGKANVLSRGIIGSTQDITYVASPLYKQRFNLSTGECLDSEDHKLKTFDVRIENDQVQLKEAS
ncbi:nitrite reductase small subunit NirD [Psychromonas sp. GE-S-Ul-11]|uniref:nitrite reductase small subunit NirD n=1 Tax=Psychromonas sp. GE-S-Ul-11 TaxID=3241170 RepID=UPI00390C6DA9